MQSCDGQLVNQASGEYVAIRLAEKVFDLAKNDSGPFIESQRFCGKLRNVRQEIIVNLNSMST